MNTTRNSKYFGGALEPSDIQCAANQKSNQDRFWSRVVKMQHSPPPTMWNLVNPCWMWTGRPVGNMGYGRIKFGHRTCYVHRFSYTMAYGIIPDGIFVLHKCDIPRCVNPEHLFLGNHQDNSDDKMRKGRDRKVRGEIQHLSKLTAAEVEDIRNLSALGKKRSELAQLYALDWSTIDSVVKGITWKHVPFN